MEELHRSFASLSQEDQRFAELFLGDVQSGEVKVDANKTFREYVSEYRRRAQDSRVHRFAESFGLDEALLRKLVDLGSSEESIDEFGRFSRLLDSADRDLAKAYFEQKEGRAVPAFRVSVMLDKLLRDFVLGREKGGGGIDIG